MHGNHNKIFGMLIPGASGLKGQRFADKCNFAKYLGYLRSTYESVAVYSWFSGGADAFHAKMYVCKNTNSHSKLCSYARMTPLTEL